MTRRLVSFTAGFVVVMAITVSALYLQLIRSDPEHVKPPHRERHAAAPEPLDETVYLTPFDLQVREEIEAVAAYLAGVEAERIANEERARAEEAERAAAAVRQVPRSTGSGGQTVTDGDVWGALAQCESGGDPGNKRNPAYRGAFQFSWATWAAMGGTGDPADASYEEQLARAQDLQARAGWGQWPECSSRLGLR